MRRTTVVSLATIFRRKLFANQRKIKIWVFQWLFEISHNSQVIVFEVKHGLVTITGLGSRAWGEDVTSILI